MSLAGAGGAAPKRLPIPKPARGTVQYGPPGSTFHPDQSSSGGSLADVIAQAKSVANQQVQAQVQAIQAQQHIATQQAAARAAQINQASRAAAAYLQNTGLAGRLQQQDYQQAINNTQGLASGFSGQLKQDAQAQADQAQQMLGSVAGNTQQLENKGEPLGQVLYGLGGSIPGNALNVQGFGAVTAARALPAATLGYGQQQGVAALQSGQGQAASLEGQIAQAQAQRPSITSNLVGQFTSAYNQAQSSALQAQEVQSLIDNRAAATKIAATNANTAQYRATTEAQYQQQTQKLAADKLAVQQAYQSGQLTLAQRKAKVDALNKQATQELNGQKLKVQQAYESGQLTIQQKRLQIEAINAQTARINATRASSASATASQPTSGSIHDLNSWLDTITVSKAPQQRWNAGTKAYEYWDPSTGAWSTTLPASSGPQYQQIMQEALTQGPVSGPKTPAWRKQVIAAVQAKIPEGELGRPYTTPALEQHAALQNATQAASTGVPWHVALNTMVKSGYFPHRKVVLSALHAAYRLHGIQIPKVDLSTSATVKPKGYQTPSSGPKKDIPQFPVVSGPQIPLP